MSWSTTSGTINKAAADATLDALSTGTGNPHHEDQLRIAKAAAKLIIGNIPGPMIIVSMSGHANGVGWQSKEGWANDCISVSVSQVV